MPEQLDDQPDTRRTSLAAAQSVINQIGGFHGNGADELAPTAAALALISIAESLERIANALTKGDA